MTNTDEPATTINTRSGAVLDLLAPNEESIRLEDIAVGLARAPRFGGQTTAFYSVAQHSITVAKATVRLDRLDLAIAALHHDAHEAFVCDVPTPVKRRLEPEYKEITAGLDRAIAEALGFQIPEGDDAEFIKKLDQGAFNREAESLFSSPPPPQDVDNRTMAIVRSVSPDQYGKWTESKAEKEFIKAHRRFLKLMQEAGQLTGKGHRSSRRTQPTPADPPRQKRLRILELPGIIELLEPRGRVVLAVYLDANLQVSDIAARAGVSPKTVYRCLTDLEAGGFLTRDRVGRQNHYTVDLDAPTGVSSSLGDLVDLLTRE